MAKTFLATLLAAVLLSVVILSAAKWVDWRRPASWADVSMEQRGSVNTTEPTSRGRNLTVEVPPSATERRESTGPCWVRRSVVLGNGSTPLPDVKVRIAVDDRISLERASDERGTFECDQLLGPRSVVTVSYPALDVPVGRVAIRQSVATEWIESEGEIQIHLSVVDGVIISTVDDSGRSVPARLSLRLTADGALLWDGSGLHPMEIRGSAFLGGLAMGHALEVTAWHGGGDAGDAEAPTGAPLAVGRSRVLKIRAEDIPTAAVRLVPSLKRVRVRLAAVEEDGLVFGAAACPEVGRNLHSLTDADFERLMFKPDPASPGWYWVDSYPDIHEGLSIVAPAGGAFLTPQEVESLEDGDVIPLTREGFLTGHWAEGVGCSRSQEGLVHVVLANGKTMESCFISGGVYCVFVGDAVPRKLELYCREAQVVVEHPIVGELQIVD